MPIPIAVPIVAGLAALTLVGLRMRAVSKASAKRTASGALPPAAGSASPTAESRAAVANIPPGSPPVKNRDGTVSAEELARSLAVEKIRAAQLTTDQLRAIEQNAIPGKTVAEFDGNGTAGGAVLPVGTFPAGSILPSDHVSINIRAAGLSLPPGVTGDLLIRATALNTETAIRGISIDPRFTDATERDFPLSAVTGIAPVTF